MPTAPHHAEAPTLWIDVEDLFIYARYTPRLSGIQRVAAEVYTVLQRDFGAQVRFVRHHQDGKTLAMVPWSRLEAVFAQLSGQRGSVERPAPVPAERAPARRRWSPETRQRWQLVIEAQRLVWHAVLDLDAHLRPGRRTRPPPIAPVPTVPAPVETAPPAVEASDFERAVRPGDMLVVLGSAWSRPDYGAFAEGLLRHHGMRLGLLVYDLIPLRRPEWCDASLVSSFQNWYESTLPLASRVLAISEATRRDVERHACEIGVTLRAPVRVIPMGTERALRPGAGPGSERLPKGESFVLFVSTIEARKNHALAFRVWRRLVDTLPAQQVPLLVFAGRVGWLVDDLIGQLRNCDHLGGKVRLIEDVSDDELARLYAECLFTIFPSFFEGWGLPVTESLASGAPCIASNVTSVPEAGGALCRYIDPDNVSGAYTVIREAIEHPAALAAWRDEIAARFVPTPWSETAHAIHRALAAA